MKFEINTPYTAKNGDTITLTEIRGSVCRTTNNEGEVSCLSISLDVRGNEFIKRSYDGVEFLPN